MSGVDSLTARFAEERGVGLVELLVAIPTSIVILLAVSLMSSVSFSQTAKVTDRVETVQRGRSAMDQVIRQLRSQVCPATTGAALTSGSDDSLTFYADLSGGSADPERRTITYDPGTSKLTEYSYVGTGTWPDLAYPGTPTRTRELLTDVGPVAGTSVFSYYAFTTTGTITPSVRLATPLATADLPRVVRIAVSFVARPSRTNQPPQATTFQNQVDVRTANPNNPTETTRCL